MAVALAWIAGLVGAPMVAFTERAELALVALVGAMGVAIGARAIGAGLSGAVLIASALVAGFCAGRGDERALEVTQGVCRIEADVVDVRYRARRASSTVRVVSGERASDGMAVPRGIDVRLPVALPSGARVRAVVRVRAAPRYRNHTPHPSWPYDAPEANGALPPGTMVEVLRTDPIAGALEAMRSATRRALDASLEPRAAGVARALVLGDGGAVEEQDRDAVRDAGLAHVLAVSGLHVSLVAGLIVLALRRMILLVPTVAARIDPRRSAAALGIPIALFYAAFAGGAPSAWRAAVTAALAWILVAAGRRPRAVTVACGAGALLAAASPAEAARPGFVLSILATTAIVTARLPVFSAMTQEAAAIARPRELLRAALAISARTTAATAPVVLWCFGTVPVVGVIANVVLVPIGTLILVPLAVLHAGIATVAPPLAPLTAGAFEGASAAFVAACNVMAGALPGVVPPPPTVPQGIAIALGCFVMLVARTWPQRVCVMAVCCALVACGEIAVRHEERPVDRLRVTFLDVGQGDGALLDMPDGRLVLIDAGGARSSFDDPGQRVILPLLAARRRSRIDVAVITHPHPDHYGGLGAIVGRVPIGEVWDTGQAEAESPDGPVAAMLGRAREGEASVLGPSALCRRPRRFGRATVRVIAPCPRYDPGRDPNDNSFVLRVSFGRRAFLFTGDAEVHQEERAAREHGDRLRADVLKVAHHGSRTSSTSALLGVVRPQLAVVSAGRANRYGHPHGEALVRLKEAETRVLRLDRTGGAIVETDGERMTVRTWLGDAFELPSPP